jgi:choline kinase
MTKLKAVILAAGRGHRISGVGPTPKPLLPLDGKPGGVTFLDWHVAQLSASGVREIYVVGNDATCGTPLPSPPDTVVRWILNPTPDLATSGSLHSASFAWESEHQILDGESRVLLMDADIVYERPVLDVLLGAASGLSRTLVCSDYRQSDEEVMVFGEGHRAILHGKGLVGTTLTRGLTCFGEATGIVLFEPEDHALVAAVTSWCLRFSTSRQRSEHEDATQRMMAVGRIEAVCFRDLHFMECDTPEEYAFLTTTLYPRILG